MSGVHTLTWPDAGLLHSYAGVCLLPLCRGKIKKRSVNCQAIHTPFHLVFYRIVIRNTPYRQSNGYRACTWAGLWILPMFPMY